MSIAKIYARNQLFQSARAFQKRFSSLAISSQSYLATELLSFDPDIPIQKAYSPPVSWYTEKEFLKLEQDQIYGQGWQAVDVVRCMKPGDYQAGHIFGRPYLITLTNDSGTSKTKFQAFWNVCPHMGGCVVVPRDKETGKPILESRGIKAPGNLSGIQCSNPSRAISGFAMDPIENRKVKGGNFFTCPYHGWRFNQDGRLIASIGMKGIEEFKPREHGLKRIGIHIDGPVIYLNFSDKFSMKDQGMNANPKESSSSVRTQPDLSSFHSTLKRIGYDPAFKDVEWVHTREYIVKCNWKVFLDNYGDGCYHCKVAHPALAANIDEDAYFTNVLSEEISVQHAPAGAEATKRFGNREAIYTMVYPNIMYNRYGRWLDTNIVKPLTEDECIVQIDWFLEKDNDETDEERKKFIEDSLKSSKEVQHEDVFLCENVQTGMKSGGFYRGRYIPGKQLAGYHFHQRLSRDLRHGLKQRIVQGP